MRLPVILSALLVACAGGGEPRVEPASGAFSGGDPLTIVGEGFAGRGPLVVYVCERAAKGIVVEGDRMIRLRTPRADRPGGCDVTIAFGDGESITLADAFAYEVPSGDEVEDPFDQVGALAE